MFWPLEKVTKWKYSKASRKNNIGFPYYWYFDTSPTWTFTRNLSERYIPKLQASRVLQLALKQCWTLNLSTGLWFSRIIPGEVHFKPATRGQRFIRQAHSEAVRWAVLAKECAFNIRDANKFIAARFRAWIDTNLFPSKISHSFW